jgi:hypothetical protein
MNGKLYSRMLSLYPEHFRHEFGAEMTAVFEDALRDAHQRGALAVLQLWWREVVLLPRGLFGADAPYHWSPRLVALLALVLLVATGGFASHLVATTGLYNVASLAVLATGLLGAGFLFGAALAGRRVRLLTMSIAIAVATLIAAPALDRVLLDVFVDKTSLSLPGVRLDASRVNEAKAYHAMVENARASNTDRVRIHTRTVDGFTRVTTLRSGGVDGAYALLTMLALAATAACSWRLCRN